MFGVPMGSGLENQNFEGMDLHSREMDLHSREMNLHSREMNLHPLETFGMPWIQAEVIGNDLT